MDDLRRMAIFYHVVNSKSFSQAARHLGIAKSAVSRHINLLEKHIGVRLLNRTTRTLSLTEAGEAYFQGCARIVAEADTINRRVNQLQEEPIGTLKISGPVSFGSTYLASIVAEFSQKYPELNVELLLDDKVIDMVAEGIDVGIRVGWLPDSNLVAKKIGDWPMLLCASPDYLNRYGRPETPADLVNHKWIVFSLFPKPNNWLFTKDNVEESIQLKGHLKTNNADCVRTFMLKGMGLSPSTSFMIGKDIEAGLLERVLPDYDCGNAGMYAVYQDRHYQQTKVRLFIDYVDQRFKRIL